MIIIKLTGGLGNQLFQYAKGRADSIKNKEDLLLDISWFKGRIDRSYLLDNFNIKAKIASKLNILVTSIFNKRKYLIGDWQSEKNFVDISEIIRKEFKTKLDKNIYNNDNLRLIQSTNSVSIHLRGGDYVRGKKSSFHGTCSPDYYSKAIDYIKKEVKAPYFIIFTDDLDWAKKHISFPEPFLVVKSDVHKPYIDLFLMSQCKYNIIANSTFSWWAAWLNNNDKKTIIAPRKWFNDEKIDTSDILPESWIKM